MPLELMAANIYDPGGSAPVEYRCSVCQAAVGFLNDPAPPQFQERTYGGEQNDYPEERSSPSMRNKFIEDGNVAQEYESAVLGAGSLPAGPVITPLVLPFGLVGVPYSEPVALSPAGTAPRTWNLLSGSVPGLTFNTSNGVFSGVPTTPGVYSLLVRVDDFFGLTDEETVSITIYAAPIKYNPFLGGVFNSGVVNKGL